MLLTLPYGEIERADGDGICELAIRAGEDKHTSVRGDRTIERRNIANGHRITFSPALLQSFLRACSSSVPFISSRRALLTSGSLRSAAASSGGHRPRSSS